MDWSRAEEYGRRRKEEEKVGIKRKEKRPFDKVKGILWVTVWVECTTVTAKNVA